MAQKKLIDLTGAPFIVELRDDGKWYIVGVKLRKRNFIFEANGLPAEVVEKIDGVEGNDKIDGLGEIIDYFDGMPEGEKFIDKVPDEFASDDDVVNAWEEALEAAKS